MSIGSKVQNKIVSQEQWLSARKELLTAEKGFTRQSDALSTKRRELPWVKLEKNTSSTPATAKYRYPTFSATSPSSSSITSGSALDGDRVAQAAHFWAITSMAPSCI